MCDKRDSTPPRVASTFDLLTWPESPDIPRSPCPVRHSALNSSRAFVAAAHHSVCDNPNGRPTMRMKPARGLSTIKFGEQQSAEEAASLLKRRLSAQKRREMIGSGIFDGDSNDGRDATADKLTVPCHQPDGGASHFQLGGQPCVPAKKPVTLTEVAKQRELSGTVETVDDLNARRCSSHAKAKELVGSNIFGTPPPESPRSLEPAGGRCQVSYGGLKGHDPEGFGRKAHNQKIADLSGHDIFHEDISEKNLHHQLSEAKLREMHGSNIFKDDKPAGRNSIGGVRKPPGGGSSIVLV